MHVLVTGAGGYSGGAVLKQLLDAGHQVTALTGASAGRIGAAPGLTVHAGDLAGDAPLPKDADAILHLAARSPYHRLPTAELIRQNVLGTARLVRHAQASGIGRLLFCSSISVYGDVTQPEVDETTPIVNPNAYGMSKRLGELILAECGETLASVSLRLPGLIGPGLNASWLAAVLRKAKAGEEIAYVNPEAPFNNAVHVEDLARFLTQLLVQPLQGHDILTLGTLDDMSVRAVVETLISAAGSRSALRVDSRRMPPFRISSRRAVERYGYRSMALADALRRFVSENAGAVV
jgi:UDP-glucose 4-epimerase